MLPPTAAVPITIEPTATGEAAIPAAAAPAAFLSLVVLQYLFSSPEMCGFSYEASLVCSVLLVAVIGVLCLFRGSGLEKAEEPSL